MSSSYVFSDAVDIIRANYPKITSDSKIILGVNAAVNMIWRSFDWPDFITKLPPFWLAPGQQYYGSPYYAVPSNYRKLLKSWLWLVDDGYKLAELKILQNRADTGVEDMPNAIEYSPKIKAFKVFPPPHTGIGYTEILVEGEYKRAPITITRDNISTEKFFWNDEYLFTFSRVLEYFFAKFSGSPTAGQVQLSGGTPMFSGLLGEAIAAIDSMASDEGISRGDDTLVPDIPFYAE